MYSPCSLVPTLTLDHVCQCMPTSLVTGVTCVPMQAQKFYLRTLYLNYILRLLFL